jgi:hypothetical protein
MSRVATILTIIVFATAFARIANSEDSTTVSTDHAAGTTTTTTVHTTVHHHHHHRFHPVNEASRIVHHPVHETSLAIHDATGTQPERPKPLP